MREGERPPEWELLESEKVAEYTLFGVRRDRVRIPRTGTVREMHVVEGDDGVTVLAFTADDRMLLVEQFRNPDWRLSLETPSGVLGEGEDPLEAGLRELREETGFSTGVARVLGSFRLNPSWQTTRVHVVLAEGCVRDEGKDQDDAEDIRTITCSRGDIAEMVRDGRLDSAVALAALALLHAGSMADL